MADEKRNDRPGNRPQQSPAVAALTEVSDRPRAGLTETVAVPVAPDAKSELKSGPPRWRVKLRDNPEMEVLGVSAADAIENYRQMCGILSTPHKFECSLVE